MIMNQNKEYFFRLVESKYSLGSKSCFAAIGFININNQPHVLDGYVVDKYFIDAKTEKIYPIADFSLINNVESFLYIRTLPCLIVLFLFYLVYHIRFFLHNASLVLR